YKSGVGWSVAGVAYLLLLGLGALSFAVNHRDWRGWRIVIWTVFAALSIYHRLSIPFFAVVGGPIAALNFQDAVARYFGTAPRISANWRQSAIAGRLFTLVVGVLLVALAWPGWLHATVARGETAGRNVAWRVDFDASLRQAAEQLQRWHEAGILGKDERGLNMAPDIAYALAWFAPDEKSFIDARLALYEKSAKDYVAAARALQLDPDSRQWDLTQLDRLVPILRQYKINHLIFSYTEHNRIPEVLSLFENDPQK